VLAGLGGFWGAVLVAGAANPGYSQRRDYVSTLASRGAEHGWLGVLGIAAAAVGMLSAALLLRHLSRAPAVAMALAGAGFLVVAFTRLECSKGAAGCGLGGRFAISGATDVTHWTATTVSTVLVIAGIAMTGVALVRLRRTLAGLASLAAAVVTTGAFLATGGQSPGDVQRLGIAVATGWLAGVALATLWEEDCRRRRLVSDGASAACFAEPTPSQEESMTLTTTANLVEHSTLDETTRFTATFGRDELEALLSADTAPMLWFDLGIEGEAEARRLTVELTESDLEALLEGSGEDVVLLAIDGEGLAGLLDEPDVEAHGMRSALAVAIATAAIAAPSGLAATQQGVGAAATQQGVGAAATSQQVGSAAATQVSSQIVRSQIARSAAKPQRAAPVKFNSLTILRAGVVR
jgi:hypothetical protein